MSNTAKKKTEILEQLATPKGTAKYAWLEKPDNSEYGKNKYKCWVLLEKGVEANDKFAQKIKDLHKQCKGKADSCPVKDGDELAEENEKQEAFRGFWAVKASTKKKPALRNPANKPLVGPAPRSGDLVRLALAAAKFDTGANKGCTLYLNAVQLLERRTNDGSNLFGDESAEYELPDSDDDGGFRDESGADSDSDEGNDGDY